MGGIEPAAPRRLSVAERRKIKAGKDDLRAQSPEENISASIMKNLNSSSKRKEILDLVRKERHADWVFQQKEEAKKEERKRRSEWQSAMMDGSTNKGCVSLYWKEFGSIDSVLYEFQSSFGIPLLELRLIGIGIKELPNDFGENMRSLRVLSLRGNLLETLPDTILHMTSLEDLCLLKNRIKKLPDRIGLMSSLKILSIAGNFLELLPITFGALNQIQRCDLEANQLKLLPENLDNMLSCSILNVNNNKLTYLPRCLGRMPSLTSLSASDNQIHYLPDELTNSRDLKYLRLCRNQIKRLPDKIGDCKKLKELSIDWNKLGNLPYTFYQLKKLRYLRLEGNENLNDPQPEILVQGAQAVVAYFTQRHKEDIQYRMRLIVAKFQNCLAQLNERNLADPSLFEADCTIPNDNDGWFGTHTDYLFQELMPKLKKIWRREMLQGIQHADWVTNFAYEDHEVIEAFTVFADVYGPVLRRGKAMFRRCSCVDDEGKRKPCIPPKVGFMCERICTLFKMHIVRKRDKAERLWKIYKENGIADAVKRAEAEAKKYVDSVEGHLWLEKLAYEKAEEWLVEQGGEKAVAWRQTLADARKKKIMHKFDRIKKRVQKVRDSKAFIITKELNALQIATASAPPGYLKEKLEARIDQLTESLAKMPETIQLQRLQLECESKCHDIDEDLFESSSDSSVGSDDSEPSEDDDTEEAAAKREKLLKKIERDRKIEKLRKESQKKHGDDGDDLPREFSDVVKEKLYGYWHNFVPRNFDREMGRRKIYRHFLKKLRHVRDVADLRIKKMYSKANGTFDEIQREYRHELYHQYINDNVMAARRQAEKEFQTIDTIRNNMSGSGTAIVFQAWKKYAFTKKQRERRDLRLQWKTQIKGFDAAMQSVRVAQGQVDLWEKHTDIYTDQPFWTHKLTGEISMDEPGLHHYLPPSFRVPTPPPKLPDGFSLDTSSSESESEFMNRAKKRITSKRKKKSTTSKYGKSEVNEENEDADNKEEEEEEEEEDDDDDERDELENNELSTVASENDISTVSILPPIEPDKEEWITDSDRVIGPKGWSLPSIHGSDGNVDEDKSVSSKSLNQSVISFNSHLSERSKFSYGPDTLTFGKPGRNGRALFQEEESFKEKSMTELEKRVLEAREYMKSASYNSIVELPDVHKTEIGYAYREKLAIQKEKEMDRTERAIRKKRNAMAETRYHTYMHQRELSLKPRLSSEQLAEQKRANIIEVEKYERPDEHLLLDLIGGTKDMIHHSHKEGLELRTILAQRALHAKEKIHNQAVKAGLAKPKRTSLYKNNIEVIWREDYESDPEETEDEIRRRERVERKAKRRKAKEDKALLEAKLHLAEKEKADKTSVQKEDFDLLDHL